MFSWARAAVRWARGQKDNDGRPQVEAGIPRLANGELAILATEAMACEALTHGQALTSSIPVESELPEQQECNAFGQPVSDAFTGTARGAVASACGLALAGIRTSAFVPGGRLSDLHDQLSDASRRRIPVLVHGICDAMSPFDAVPDGGHEGYHSVADTGAFLVMGKNAQDAVDLTLAARLVAEASLTPGVVAMDGAEVARSVQDVVLPSAKLIRKIVGDPSETLDAPTPGQQIVLGEKRRRVPRWFDLEHPAALGTVQTGADYAVGRAGQDVFFAEKVFELVTAAMAKVSTLTGRPLSWIEQYGLEDAEEVIVAQGAVVETAIAVAEKLRKTQQRKVGVLGITWLRPFPAEQVRKALSRAKRISVLERVDDAMASAPPLLREVRVAIEGSNAKVTSVIFGLGVQAITGAQLESVFAEMARDNARSKVRLGISVPSKSSEFPKREVLLQSVGRAAPDLARLVLPEGKAVDYRPSGARTIALYSHSAYPHESALNRMARLLSEKVGSHLRSRSLVSTGGLWTIRVTAAAEPFRNPGDGGPVEVALFTSLDLPESAVSLAEVVEGGAVVVVHPLGGEWLWRALPRQCREAVRSRKLKLFAVCGDSDGVAESVELATGGDGGLEPVEWASFAALSKSGEAEPPLAVRRFSKVGATFDNVPRFWGEVFEPRLDGGTPDPVPDPYIALGAVPAGTSTFHDRTPGRKNLPKVEASECTGCGKCWTACPDAAISPVALSVQEWLDSAADRAAARRKEANPVADKLKRAHKQLASRVEGQLAKGEPGVLSNELLVDCFGWLVEKMKVTEDEQPAMVAAFDETLAEGEGLAATVSQHLFFSPHAQEKGSGVLLMLAVNPQSCQGCGACGAVCGDGAISIVPQSEDEVESLESAWKVWERLPDTSGSTIARACDNSEVGPLAALLMSRHCLMTAAGGDGAEPGSGERLAARLVTAVVEYQRQRATLGQVTDLEKLSGELRDAARTRMSSGLENTDLEALDHALSAGATKNASLSDVLGRLDELGQRASVDSGAIRKVVLSARELADDRARIAEGGSGAGSSRFALLVAGESVASWAARFPHNPFSVPVAVDLSGTGPEQAMGLAEALLINHTRLVRRKRHARLLLDAPSDLVVKERELDRLSWAELSEEERAECPPVLVLAGADALTGRGLEGLSRLLDSDLPVKVILLDGRDVTDGRADPSMLALAHRKAFVLAASIAHHQQFFDGISAALSYPGPALIHIMAPRPGKYGFETDSAVERARAAVVSRVHPLMTYDPAGQGAFGQRLSLAGNPGMDGLWCSDGAGNALTPAHWAKAERRFGSHFRPLLEGESAQDIATWAASTRAERSGKSVKLESDGKAWFVDGQLARAVAERLENWSTLQELAGIRTPFVEEVKSAVSTDLEAAHAAEISALKADFDKQLAQARQEMVAGQAAQLRSRLMQLAGIGESGVAGGNGQGGAL